MKHTESLIRSLIVEERRRVTPSLFPELEPADEDLEKCENEKLSHEKQSFNQSVRQIVQAERDVGASGQLRHRRGLLERAFGALRRRPNDSDDSKTSS